ncbi:MAG: M20/M25/M40 family metallo-hydrolase, partial [Thermacetogeniaceae bacterium]
EMKTKRVAFSLLVSLLAAFSATAQRPDGGTQIIEGIEAKHQAYADVALQIWKFAETGYQEVKSSALLEAKLAEAGFTVQKGVADIPTAFVANYGSGKPVIAFIGEYDALPGLSQEAVPEKKPVLAGAPGHGCGHNLLGTAAMAAAIAVKDWMASAHREGTVRFYGTPAEEGGSGKVYMVRAGLFKDVDVAVTKDWTPEQVSTPSSSSWGDKGYFEVWVNGANDWIWRHLHKASERMVELANNFPEAGGDLRRALGQAARELLLAQSSDWPFIMKTGTMVEYAKLRFETHISNFTRLYEEIKYNRIDPGWLGWLEQQDNLFPEIDYQVYQSRHLGELPRSLSQRIPVSA